MISPSRCLGFVGEQAGHFAPVGGIRMENASGGSPGRRGVCGNPARLQLIGECVLNV